MKDLFFLERDMAPYFDGLYEGDLASVLHDDSIALGYVEEGRAAGLLVASGLSHADTHWLDWLYVLPQYRNRGIGGRILDFFLQKCKEAWPEGEIRAVVHGNEDVLFFQNMGFILYPEGSTYRTTLKALNMPHAMQEDETIRFLGELASVELKKADAALADADVDVMAAEIPLVPGDYLAESVISLEDDELQGLLLLSEQNGICNLDYVYTERGSSVLLGKMLNKAATALLKREQEITGLTMTAMDEKVEKIIEKSFDDYQKTRIWSGVADLMLLHE